MAGKADAARAALHKVKALHEDFHEPILAELDKAGLLDNDAPHGNGGQWHRVGDLHAKGTKPPIFPRVRNAAVLTWCQAASNPQYLQLLRSVHGSARGGSGSYSAR